jgi:hypothetical protein
MRKVIAFLLILALLIGGLIFANNISQQSNEAGESKEAVEVSEQQQSEYPPLHYFRQDRYPTKEELPQFHIFKGQFPLDNRNGDIELHNFNE